MKANKKNDTTFKITYWASKHKKHITRIGKWVEGCRFWKSAKGVPIFTYWDIEADNFRNATTTWSIKK